jgi:Peptidase family M28
MVSLLLSIALAADPFPFEKEEAELSAGIFEHELKAHVYRLAGPEFLGRKGDGGTRAAEHIAGMFAKLKLKPAFGESFFQPIPWLLTTPRADGSTIAGRNVGAYIPGSDPALADEWIILAAHYDHLGQRDGKTYFGADDNASGVAMLLEVAEAFALTEAKPKRSIYFLSFDLEEVGLGGSTHFAAHPPRDLAKMKAFLVADLLGRSMADVMDEYLFVLGTETSPGLATVVDAMPAIPGLTTGKLGADLVGTRSDYGPFRDRKIPFLFFTTGIHRDYHKPTDLPERINYAKLTRNSRYIEVLTRKLADVAEPPRWEPSPLGPGMDEVATVQMLFDRALAKPDVVKLTDTQRQRFVESRDRLAAIAERKTMTADERTWLINIGRWALATVF